MDRFIALKQSRGSSTQEMQERQANARERGERMEVLSFVFMPHDQPSLMPQPRECPLHRPAVPVFLGVFLDGTPLTRFPVLRSPFGRDAGADAALVQRVEAG